MKNEIPFYFIDEVVVRSPAYPFKKRLNADDIYAMLEDTFFLEAIYVASPLLYDECVKLKKGIITGDKEKNKILQSLYKYAVRMHTRSTPFGLFSTSGLARWSESETERGYEKETFTRHTRLDMHFLHKMITLISQAPDIQEYIRYFPNNSFYPVGSDIRYIEFTYKNDLRHYKISAVKKNDFILKILELAKTGITKNEIIHTLIQGTVGEGTARRFAEEMIGSQLLISEFDVSLTNSHDFTVQIQNHLERLYQRSGSEYIHNLLQFFTSIIADVNQLDKVKVPDINAYKSIVARLKELHPQLEESKVFHIDSYRVNSKTTVHNHVQADLQEVFWFLKKMNFGNYDVNEKLEAFKNKFSHRYETQTVSLAEVLDADFGIGYPVDKPIIAGNFVDDIPFDVDEKDDHFTLNMKEKWLLALMLFQENKEAYSISLENQQLPPQSNSYQDSWYGLPASISCMFRVVNDEKDTILLEHFFGPSAASVLSRFCHGNDEIKNTVCSIIEKEEAVFDNCVFAEIVHMPDNRITNVIMHPPFRKYEIPYLATASVADENIITLNDLFIKLENNEIILFSKRLNKRVIPCKTHVHNHFTNTLPLYHFLGDLQHQGANRSMNFSWGTLAKLFKFLPRVCYKNVILSPAMWTIPKNFFDVDNRHQEHLVETFEKIRKLHNIPEQVLYSEGDNELLVDFTDPLSINTWLNLIRHKKTILLKEFLWIGDTDGRQYVNQYIATLISKETKNFGSPVPENTHLTGNNDAGIQRTFTHGSEWLYLKIYCGLNSSDLLLTNIISPIVNILQQQGLIKKWFFIKYADPDHHIRLRFLLHHAADTGKVLETFNQRLNLADERQLVAKIQSDMYVREIERYGANTMELCESIFFVDSLFGLEILKVLGTNKDETLKALWGVKLVDDFLNGYKLTLKEKAEFADLSKKSFHAEFRANKGTLDKINAKYTIHRNTLKEIMSGDAKNKSLYNLLNQKAVLLAPLLDQLRELRDNNKLTVDLFQILSSLIHMMLNRLITQKERLHEFLVIEFLSKYYTTQLHLNKAEKINA